MATRILVVAPTLPPPCSLGPRCQGAIDTARAELRQGNNEQSRRIAQRLIVTQQQKLPVMRLALGEPFPQPTSTP
jgi:hypothetical protein